MLVMLSLGMLGTLASRPAVGAPPLGKGQREQLSTAIDGGNLDEGALYPLLVNAAKWRPTDERGASVPDYERLENQPEPYRGDVFLIEGIFVRQRVRTLARANPQVWGRSLIEWVVKTSSDPNDVRVILFVDPDKTMIGHAPEPGRKVRVSARFYKVWTQQQDRGPVSFVTFIAPGATPSQAPGRYLGSANPGASGKGRSMLPSTSATAIAVLVVLLIGFGLIVYRLRRMAHSRRTAHRLRLHPRGGRGFTGKEGEDDDEPEPREDLPENPAEAMSVLRSEHDVHNRS